MKGGIRLKRHSEYSVTLYEILNTVINSGESNARLVVDYLKSHGLIREE